MCPNMDIPKWLHIGAAVKVRYWYAEVTDILQSDCRCIVILNSPNALWRGKDEEWVEYIPGEDVFQSASFYDLLNATYEQIRHVDLLRERLVEQAHEIEEA